MFSDYKSLIDLFDFPLAVFEKNHFNIVYYNKFFAESLNIDSANLKDIFLNIDFEKIFLENKMSFEYNCKLNKRKNIPFEFFISEIDQKNFLIYGINILKVKENESFMKSFMKVQKENSLLKDKIENNAIEMASMIQKSLLPLPSIITKNFSISCFYQPSISVGGDWYNYFLEEDLAHVYIGDITGHGVAPALLTGVIAGVFQKHCMTSISLKKEFSNPKCILNDFNEILFKFCNQKFLMTMLAMVISKNKLNIISFSAGHNFPLIIKKSAWSGKEPLEIKPILNSGNRLGYKIDLEIMEKELELNAGDIIFAYTDGIVEGISKGTELGMKKLIKILQKNFANKEILNEKIMENIKNDILNTFDSKILEDDISAIAIELLR